MKSWGGTLYPFQKGESGNPGGLPKGFIKLSTAYARVSNLPLSELAVLRAGGTPKGWKSPVPSVFALAAGQLLAGIGAEDKDGVPKANASSAIEIADRTEGKVAQAHVAEMLELAKGLAEKHGISADALLALAKTIASEAGR